jgi:hypothetical protein
MAEEAEEEEEATMREGKLYKVRLLMAEGRG